jgi:nucleolar protein 9
LKVGILLTLFSSFHLWPFQEKIARSLISQEQFLAASYYGKFFARHLNLYLLQRRPDEWRTLQTDRNRPVEQPTVSVPIRQPVDVERKKRKRDLGGDEIEELFSTAIGKKVKKAALAETAPLESNSSPSGEVSTLDVGLSDVMGAIRAAPAEGKSHGKRKGRSL